MQDPLTIAQTSVVVSGVCVHYRRANIQLAAAHAKHELRVASDPKSANPAKRIKTPDRFDEWLLNAVSFKSTMQIEKVLKAFRKELPKETSSRCSFYRPS